VKGGVEDGHVGEAGEAPPGLVELLYGEGVVQRSERLQLLEVGPHVVVHQHWAREPVAAVDDAVGDRLDGCRVDIVQ